MMELVFEVTNLIKDEYDRASNKFGPINHSDHESYAIILEELEEAEDESALCREAVRDFWEATKDKLGEDSDKIRDLDRVYNDALLAACEYIQVAAMAYKAKLTIDRKEEQ